MMMKHLIAILSFLLLLPVFAAAQEHPALTAQPNTVYVSADGKFEAAPDTAQIQFNIAAQEDKAKAAYEHASRDADQFRQILRSNGIDPKTAEIGFYSVQPVYDWKNPKRKLIAYRVSANVSLKLRDFSKIAPILQQLADGNVGENQAMNYTLENMDSAKEKAVQDAYRHARMNADAVASAGRRTLGEMVYASVDTFEQARPAPILARANMRMMGAQAEAPTEEFTPQNVAVTAHVNALFNLK
jgi:uncharacterized protein YggE